MRVVVGVVEVDGGHLLRCGIPGYDLPSAGSCGHLWDGWHFHHLLAEGFTILIEDAGHAEEVPDGTIRRGESADGCNKAPVSGGPEGYGLLLAGQMVGKETASGLVAAFVNLCANANGGAALEPEWRSIGRSGCLYHWWQYRRHWQCLFSEFLHGEQALAKVVGDRLDDLGGIGDNREFRRRLRECGGNDDGEGGNGVSYHLGSVVGYLLLIC